MDGQGEVPSGRSCDDIRSFTSPFLNASVRARSTGRQTGGMAHVCPPRAHGIAEAERSCVGGDIGFHTSPALWGLRWAPGALGSNWEEALPCCCVIGPRNSRDRGMSEERLGR